MAASSFPGFVSWIFYTTRMKGDLSKGQHCCGATGGLSTGLILPGAASFVEPRGCHYVVKLVLGGSVGEMSFILRLLGLPSQGTLVSNFLSANHNYWDREKNNPGPVLVLPAVVLKGKAQPPVNNHPRK